MGEIVINPGAIDTLDDQITKLQGTVLFDGLTSSTGALSDSIKNYKYIDIYYANYDGYNDCKRIYNNYSVTGTAFWVGTYNGSKGYFKTARLLFDSDGDSFTVDRQYGVEIQSTVTFTALTNAITIEQIIGYK